MPPIPDFSLISPSTPEQLDQMRDLMREYLRSLGSAICLGSFEQELAQLPGEYATPKGLLLMAVIDDLAVGCGALRALDASSSHLKFDHPECEIKRVYTRPAWRGQSIARHILTGLITHAQRAGYAAVRLDSLHALKTSHKIYESMGFEYTQSYNEHTADECIFMRLALPVRTGSSAN